MAAQNGEKFYFTMLLYNFAIFSAVYALWVGAIASGQIVFKLFSSVIDSEERVMIICEGNCEGNDFVEIVVADRVADDLPTPSDI